MNLKALLTITLLLFCAASLKADDERIYLDANINGEPVRFAFDTGTGVPFAIFSKTAKRLNLKFS